MLRGKLVYGLAAVAAFALTFGVAFAQEKPAEPKPEAPKQEDAKKKRDAGPLGLPTSATLKEKLALTDEQVKKCDETYAGYKEKAAEAQKKLRDAGEADKRAANKEVRTLREEVAGKLREICSSDEQKKKFDELVAPKKKKAAP